MRQSRLLVLTVAVVAALLLSACGGNDADLDPEALAERLDTAAAELAEAERLDFSLEIDGTMPSGVQGLESATGFGNRTPAFDGEVTIARGGSTLSAEVIAVDGQVWAKLGFSPDFFTIDPDDYGAPDPAVLIGTPGEGVSALLGEIDIDDASQERDGKVVLTAIDGTVPGSLIAALIPSADADADYAVTVRLTDDDQIHDITLTGSFYPDAGDVTYVVTVRASDESATIEAP